MRYTFWHPTPPLTSSGNEKKRSATATYKFGAIGEEKDGNQKIKKYTTRGMRVDMKCDTKIHFHFFSFFSFFTFSPNILSSKF